MAIKLNTNKTNITVYDEVNYKHATGNEIVPFLSTVKGDFKEQLIDIISRANHLSDNSIDIYRHIIYNYNSDANISIKELINKVAYLNGKAMITYKRSIDALVWKGVIKRDTTNGFITLRKEFDINSIAEYAKYIVIELPNTMSTVDKGAHITENTVASASVVSNNRGSVDTIGGSVDGSKGVGGSVGVESGSSVR